MIFIRSKYSNLPYLKMRIYAFILLLTVRVNCDDDLKIHILYYTVAGQPTLMYLGYGDCVWELRSNITGNKIEAESDGHQIKLDHGTPHTNVKCVVNGTLLLKVTISTIDYIPVPENVTLNTATKTIHWNHVFQPSDLPSDFKLIHNYNIFYLVHGNGGVSASAPVNVPGDRNYLKFDDESVVMNGCEKQFFSVQTMINNRVSINSSVVSGNFSVGKYPRYSGTTEVPVFSMISAEIALITESIILRVSFELSREQCQGMTLTAFIVLFEGLPTYKYNVTTLDIENGSIYLTLPLNAATTLNVCSLDGVIFGSNDIGNSSKEGIYLPNDCKTVTSSATTSSNTYTLPLPSPTATLTTGTDTTGNTAVIIIVPVVLIQLIIVAVVFTVFILNFKWKRDKKRCVPLTQDSSAEVNMKLNTDSLISDAEEVPREKPINYTLVTPTPRPEEQKPKVIDIKVNYETVDHLKTEKLRQEKEAFRTANPEIFKKPQTDPQEVGLSFQLHLEPLMEVLCPVKAKWFNLGMHLNLSENFLDETETNIEMDEDCLCEMLKNWLQYHEPRMEVLNHALSQIDHQPITFDVTIQGFIVASEEGGMSSEHP